MVDRQKAATMSVPRGLVLRFPFGRPFGAPGNPEQQRVVLEDALDYLAAREAFGKRLEQMQVLQHYIADMKMMQSQAELMTFNAAWRQSEGLECGLESNMAKVVTSENAGKCADLALQMFGGMGYAYETNPQRYWRDARLYRIGPIANEMARNSIAEALGMPRSF